MATDGPVSSTVQEIFADELFVLYWAAKRFSEVEGKP